MGAVVLPTPSPHPPTPKRMPSSRCRGQGVEEMNFIRLGGLPPPPGLGVGCWRACPAPPPWESLPQLLCHPQMRPVVQAVLADPLPALVAC